MDDITPFISVCVPAYKRIEYLEKLLQSIAVQAFRDFEVIVTDDSPNESVKALCSAYESKFSLLYHRNLLVLGTPENWNEAIRKARGKWIKIMHDDDWFSNESSLLVYANAIEANPDSGFVFSAYRNINLNNHSSRDIRPAKFRLEALRKNPSTLVSTNIIGPPSVVIYKNDRPIYFDNQLKWLVDIDFYIRYLKNTEIFFIEKPLVNIGVSDHQVTRDCFLQRPIEIPENFSVLNKSGWQNLRDVLVFDAWWRLMRNLKIKNIAEIREAGYDGAIPKNIVSMIRWQKYIPDFLLKIGPFSKSLMYLNFLFHSAGRKPQ